MQADVEQVRVHADEVHQTNAAHTPGEEEVPEQDPHCYYNTSGGILARDWFTTCLSVDLHKTALKPMNSDKLLDVVQDTNGNPPAFLEHLTKALLQYANLDPETTEGKQLLMTHFFSESFPDIRSKLKYLEKGRSLRAGF